MRGGRARFNIGASLHTCGLAELEDIALSLEDIALSLEDIAISLPLGAAWRWMQRYAVYLSKILLYLSKILLYLSKILLYLDFISSNHSPHVRHRYTRSPPPHYLPLLWTTQARRTALVASGSSPTWWIERPSLTSSSRTAAIIRPSRRCSTLGDLLSFDPTDVHSYLYARIPGDPACCWLV